MENDNQKTVELTTLPNTEVFGLYNCMVKPDSIVDNLEKKTRTFEITNFYDDVSIVAIGTEPFLYRVSDTGELLNTYIFPDSLEIKHIYSNTIKDGEVILDVTATKPRSTTSGLIMYEDEYYPFTYNKNTLFENKPDVGMISILKVSVGGTKFSDYYQVAITCAYRDTNLSQDTVPSIVDFVINDKLITTANVQNNFVRRMDKNAYRGIMVNTFVTSIEGLDNDVFDPSTPINVKIIKRNGVVKHKVRPVAMTFGDDDMYHFPDVFKSYEVTVGDRTYTGDSISYAVQFVNSEDPNVDIDVTLYYKDGLSESDKKFFSGLCIPIIRFNSSNDNHPYPELDHITTSQIKAEFFKYALSLSARRDERCISFTIPNKVIQSLPSTLYSDGITVTIGYIPKTGRLTTEKPNTP